MKRRSSVKKLIYSEYLKAALLPMLIIELMLLIMYFAITNYIEMKTKETLLREAQLNIKEISFREVKNINQQLNAITSLSKILQKENSRFFKNPESFPVPAKQPIFAVAPNGVYYKSLDNGGSSLFYSTRTKIGKQEKNKALQTEAFDPLFRSILEANPDNVGVYWNSFDSLCRYYPFLPKVYEVFPADMNIPEYNFYYMADEKHNPGRGPVWTEAYLDPAGKGWMASCIAPIYNDKVFLEGVTGIDVTIDVIIKKILNLKLPWNAAAFLVDKKGVILAMPENVESILKLKELRRQVYHSTVKQDTLKPEEFNLLKNRDRRIASQMNIILTKGGTLNDLSIGEKNYFLSQSTIDITGWRLMILVDKDLIYAPIYHLDNLSKKIGFWAFAFMLLFYLAFFSYLMLKSKHIAGRIADPIIEIANRTTELKTSLKGSLLKGQRTDIEELDLLVQNFNAMTDELQEFYNELEIKVEERTQELSDTNLELTTMYENINNAKGELEKEVIERGRAQNELEQKNQELEQAYGKLKYAQMQMLQQEKMASIGQLAAGIAHEINNPMGFISSNLGSLKKYIDKLMEYMFLEYSILESLGNSPSLTELKEKRKLFKIDFISEDINDLIKESHEGADRVKKIVQDLKSFSHVDQAEYKYTDINESLDSTINIVWNELKYKATVNKEYGEIPQVKCYPQQLNQVFVNLLINAAHAIETKGGITVRTRSDDHSVYVSISDTGAGIDPKVINRIFEPFFTTKEVGKGTGLGLSITYDIIKKHGGDISVQSEVGKGTVFTVQIPVLEDKAS